MGVGLAHDHVAVHRIGVSSLVTGHHAGGHAGSAHHKHKTRGEVLAESLVLNRNSSTEFRPSAGGCNVYSKRPPRKNSIARRTIAPGSASDSRHSLASASARGLTPRGSLSALARSSGPPPLAAWNWGTELIS